MLIFQNKFNEAQIKNAEVQKFISERGPMFGIPQEDEKNSNEEMINEINERIHGLTGEVKKIYKTIENEVGVIDQKLSEKVDFQALPKI